MTYCNCTKRSFILSDNFEFEIPPLTPPRSPLTSPLQRSLGGSPADSIGELNVDLYKKETHDSSENNNNSSKKLHENVCNKSSLSEEDEQVNKLLACSFQRLHYLDGEDGPNNNDCVGEISLSFLIKNHHLIIKLVDVSLNLKPSSEVREAHWTIHPYLVIDTIHNPKSPTEKSKFHLFHKNHHTHILTKDIPCEINLKHRTGEGHVLKIVLYDGEFVNKDLAIGAAKFSISEVLAALKENEKVTLNKDLTGYHEVILLNNFYFKKMNKWKYIQSMFYRLSHKKIIPEHCISLLFKFQFCHFLKAINFIFYIIIILNFLHFEQIPKEILNNAYIKKYIFFQTFSRLDGTLSSTLLWQSSLMLFTLGINSVSIDDKSAHHTKGYFFLNC